MRLVGTVVDVGFYDPDGDWLLDIGPAEGFDHLAVNRAGELNPGQGIVGCEVEPTDPVGEFDAESLTTVNRFWEPLLDKQVSVVGTWVEDSSHHNKTEIHPITSVLGVLPITTGPHAPGNLVEFTVGSDDSFNFPAKVPHSKVSRTGPFRVVFPPRPPGNRNPPRISVISETNMAQSRSFQISELPNRRFMAKGAVVTGSPRDGKGFYHATLALSYPQPTAITASPIDEADREVDASDEEERVLVEFGEIPGLRKIRVDIGERRGQLSKAQRTIDRLRAPAEGAVAPAEQAEASVSEGQDYISQLLQEISELEQQAQELGAEGVIEALR